MKHVFLDLDGVFSDLDNYFYNTFGVSHKALDNNQQFWEHIENLYDAGGYFFLNLPLIPGGKEFFDLVKDSCGSGNLKILTSCGFNRYDKRIALEKKLWVNRNLDPNIEVLTVLSGKHKAAVIGNYASLNNKDYILVDDYDVNIDIWRIFGGTPIHHTGNYNGTLNTLHSHIFGLV